MMRRLALALLLATATPAAATPAEDLQRLLADHWQWVLRGDPVTATRLGVRDYDTALPDISLEARDREAREAQGRASRLQAVAAALSRATSLEAVARVILTEGLAHAGTHAGIVFLREPDGGLRSLHDVGYPEEVIVPMRHIPPEARRPQLDVVLTGQARWFTSTEEVVADYPHLAGMMWAYEARVGLPLQVEGRTLGCLWLSFEDQRHFSPTQRDFLTALAQLCAQALDARLAVAPLRR